MVTNTNTSDNIFIKPILCLLFTRLHLLTISTHFFHHLFLEYLKAYIQSCFPFNFACMINLYLDNYNNFSIIKSLCSVQNVLV